MLRGGEPLTRDCSNSWCSVARVASASDKILFFSCSCSNLKFLTWAGVGAPPGGALRPAQLAALAGKPTRITFNDRDAREDDKLLAASEERSCFSVPWFKHYDKEWIELYASAFRKVIENHKELLENDNNTAQGGRWYGAENE